LFNLDFKDISKANIPAKTIRVKRKCINTILISQAAMYKIGIARRINGENIAKALCEGNIRRLYQSRGGIK